jgi:hypothetical protein
MEIKEEKKRMKQKKVTEEKSKINEASVKTKVRMTDNRDAQ